MEEGARSVVEQVQGLRKGEGRIPGHSVVARGKSSGWCEARGCKLERDHGTDAIVT